MKDRHARYAALASAKENDAMGMELEERGVGATLRLWNDHDLKLLSDGGAQDALRTAIMSRSASIICVTNEVGMSLIPADAGSRLFTDLLGYTNAQLAQEMDETFLVVAGRPLRLPTHRATEKPL